MRKRHISRRTTHLRYTHAYERYAQDCRSFRDFTFRFAGRTRTINSPSVIGVYWTYFTKSPFSESAQNRHLPAQQRTATSSPNCLMLRCAPTGAMCKNQPLKTRRSPTRRGFTSGQVQTDPQHPYTRLLLSSVPKDEIGWLDGAHTKFRAETTRWPSAGFFQAFAWSNCQLASPLCCPAFFVGRQQLSIIPPNASGLRVSKPAH